MYPPKPKQHIAVNDASKSMAMFIVFGVTLKPQKRLCSLRERSEGLRKKRGILYLGW